MNKMECRVCDAELTSIHHFGDITPVNAFYDTVTRHPLGLSLCPSCKLVQLSTSTDLSYHFSEYYQQAKIAYPDTVTESYYQAGREISSQRGHPGYVFEIGSNDGYLLEKYKAAGYKVLGCDPAQNLSKKALDNGILAIPACFDEYMAKYILEAHGQTRLIHSHHMIAHMNNPLSLLKGILYLLAPGGTAIIDFQYLIGVLQKGMLDNIYHEHAMYYTLNSFNNLITKVGLKIVHAEETTITGSTMRVHLATQDDVRRVDKSIFDNEDGKYDNIDWLRTQCEWLQSHVDNFRNYIEREGRVYGYGAAARATVFLNLANISDESIITLFDDVPEKLGHDLPGTRIKIVTSDNLNSQQNDNTPIVVFPWHVLDKIAAKFPNHAHRLVSLRDIYLGKV